VRAMRARIPDPSGASRRRVAVDDPARMRTEMSMSTVDQKRFFSILFTGPVFSAWPQRWSLQRGSAIGEEGMRRGPFTGMEMGPEKSRTKVSHAHSHPRTCKCRTLGKSGMLVHLI